MSPASMSWWRRAGRQLAVQFLEYPGAFGLRNHIRKEWRYQQLSTRQENPCSSNTEFQYAPKPVVADRHKRAANFSHSLLAQGI